MIQKVNKAEFWTAVAKRVHPANVVVDVGAGIRPQRMVDALTHIIIEPHEEYVWQLGKGYCVFQAMAEEVLPLMADGAVDSIFMLDVLEHMNKADGDVVIRDAMRIVRKQVHVFTPLGFYPQDHPDGKDRWGMNGGYWQTHRSGWYPEDFPAGWDFIVCDEFHLVDQKERLLEKPVGAFWAVWNGK